MKKNSVKKEDSFSMISLSLIDKSAYNPRKYFDEADLLELADSIKEKGVIQPIVLRPIGERYEIVCGERRYRASLLANIDKIPAMIRVLSDDDAREFAVIENLQRKDVSPMEEARAFSLLLEKYGIETIAIKIGKSQSYVRGRLVLLQLHDNFQLLLDNDEIHIGIASVLATFSNEIQESVFNEHFAQNVSYYLNWKHQRAKELKESIERNYSTKLESYSFDKEECNSCTYNTANFMLFEVDGDCAKCTNKQCLDKKNEAFLLEKALFLKNENPELSLCRDKYQQVNTNVLESLQGLGNDVKIGNIIVEDEEPELPNREEYDTDEEFQEAIDDYNSEVKDYEEAKAEMKRDIESGEIRPIIRIEKSDVKIAYVRQDDLEEKGKDVKEDSDSGIKKIEDKLVRNGQLRNEKVRDDLKEEIANIEYPNTELSSLETAMLYLFMIKDLTYQDYDNLKLNIEKHSLKYSDCFILTDEQKNLITRYFVMRNVKETYISCMMKPSDNPLRAFMNEHAAETVNAIEKKYDDMYAKRNASLLEKKKAILAEKGEISADTEAHVE